MKKQNILKYIVMCILGYISALPVMFLMFFSLSEKDNIIRPGILYITLKLYNNFGWSNPEDTLIDIALFSSCFLSLVIVIIGGWFIRNLLKKNDTEKQD